MVAQEDVELFPWLIAVSHHAGDFLKNLGEAGLRADRLNYPILRPVLLAMKTKYPSYGDEEEQRMRADGGWPPTWVKKKGWTTTQQKPPQTTNVVSTFFDRR